MFSSFEFMMAGRYLRSRKSEGFVSLVAAFSFLGIMLGVATLIIVMSVMNGYRQDLISRILGFNGHAGVISSGSVYDYEYIAANIKQVKGVISAIPMIENQVLISSDNTAQGAMVRGITAEGFKSKPVLSKSLIAGDIQDFTGKNIVIGKSMANNFGLTIGDEITITSPVAKTTPFGSMPIQGSFKVIAVFDVGMYEYNRGFVFMPLDMAQKFFRTGDKVDSLEIMVENPSDIESIRPFLENAVGNIARIYDWRDVNPTLLNALVVERNVMFLILTLIILVAAFNIISSMIMLVKDKGRDIAIMRTMGATKTSMMKIFILTGSSIGFAGTFLGATLGILLSLNIEKVRQVFEAVSGTKLFAEEIYFLSQLPAEIDSTEVIVVIIIAFTLTVLATIYPAVRAAKLDPVEALRYE